MVTFILSFRRTAMSAAEQKSLIESLPIPQSDLEQMLGLVPAPGGDTTDVTTLAVERTILCNETPNAALTTTIFRERFTTPEARQAAVTRFLLTRSQALAMQAGVAQTESINPP